MASTVFTPCPWIRIACVSTGIDALDRLAGRTVKLLSYVNDSDGYRYLEVEHDGRNTLLPESQVEYVVLLEHPAVA